MKRESKAKEPEIANEMMMAAAAVTISQEMIHIQVPAVEMSVATLRIHKK